MRHDRIPPHDIEQPTLQDLIDEADERGDWQTAAMLCAGLDEIEE